jgi:hypothetical protein
MAIASPVTIRRRNVGGPVERAILINATFGCVDDERSEELSSTKY